ncbi:hypothetical protein STCU_09844 [Strigomonas culicis]|uniref:Uncharacterized protein n=1 Tax=Strigomonas culicis TaxID=28005 RepID=S9UVV1_9TRYP|nr:hypothetical protein STCU_09844 [Strigomonas culicis]|eukprot:EPY18631.1 hypothetical protein STCU_09844 [Strigomonas culicis]
MSLEKAQELEAQGKSNPTLVGYRALLGEEMDYLSAQRDLLLRAQQQKQQAAAERQRLQRELEQLQEERGLRTLTPAEARDYCRKWCELLKEYVRRKEVLTFLLSYSTADYRTADLATVAHWLDTWAAFLSESEADLRELKHIERSVAKDARLLSTQILCDALDTVCRLQLQARSLVGRERYRRAALGDEAVEDFMDSQSQLIAWCRKQRETLEDLTAMGDLIAFSDSFQKNVPVMDSNFLVIVDQSEPLMDNPKVQDALQAVNREWVRLCLMNYEKLQDGLREAHVSSNLESLCSTWMKAAEDRARQILLAAQGFLMSPGTDTDATVEGLRSTCEELLKHHEAFGVIAYPPVGLLDPRRVCAATPELAEA